MNNTIILQTERKQFCPACLDGWTILLVRRTHSLAANTQAQPPEYEFLLPTGLCDTHVREALTASIKNESSTPVL